MPGLRNADFYSGARAEYLTTFALSSIASVVPIPRQEDYGLDYLCFLVKREQRSLYAKQAFGIQAKSTPARNVRYGGLDRKEQWKRWEIEWLYTQDYPFFISNVDRTRWEISIYSTHRIWWIAWMYGWPGQVDLVPKRKERETKDELVLEDDRERYKWCIGLGSPIIKIEIGELECEDLRTQLYECLDFWIQLDRRNREYYRQGIPVWVECQDWAPNRSPEIANVEVHVFANPRPNANVPEILSAIAPSVAALHINRLVQPPLTPDKMGRTRDILSLLKSRKDSLSTPQVLSWSGVWDG